MAVLRRFPAIREVLVRRLHSDRLSMKTGVWGVAKGVHKYAVMYKSMVLKVKAEVDEAFEEEKLLRPEWEAPSVKFAQLL